MELKDKVVIVTGGARGLGEAICVELAQAGAIPVVADIRLELAETVAQNCREQGGEAIALELDVSNPEQVEAVVDQVISKYGRVNGLVNNAGTDLTVSIEEMPIHEWQRIINVNLNGPFIISKAVFTQMKHQGGGHIINIASTAAKRAWPNASAYHASKWGLLGFSHALHVEGRPHNVKGDCPNFRRNADTLFTRTLSRSRSEYAARSSKCSENGSLFIYAARGNRYFRNDGAADEGDIVALNRRPSIWQLPITHYPFVDHLVPVLHPHG